MTHQVLFSAILPTKGRPSLTRLVAESVLRQTHTSLELIVVDNDDSHLTRDAIAPLLDDPRLKYVRTGGLSMVANWNAAIHHFNGKYLVWLDSKTFFYAGAFTKLEKVIEKHPEIELFSWQYDFLLDSSNPPKFVKIASEHEHIRSTQEVLENFLQRRMDRRAWSMLPRGVCGAIAHRAITRVQDRFEDSIFEHLSPDLILSLKLLQVCDQICYLDEPLSCVASTNVSHGRNFTSRNIDTAYLMGNSRDEITTTLVPIKNNRLVSNLVANDIEKTVRGPKPTWKNYRAAYEKSIAREIGTVWGRTGNVYSREELIEIVKFWGFNAIPYGVLGARFIRCFALKHFDKLPKQLRSLILSMTSANARRGAPQSITECRPESTRTIELLMTQGRDANIALADRTT